ncbi:MAG TPA: SPOR domain-containing protein, partial [Flavobacteriales bacterium]
ATTSVHVSQPGVEKMAMASDYFYAPPKTLTSDIFSRTNRAVYNESNPIPVDMEMPSGIYYKVQVGAFRNDIPQNLYDEFAPITGERLSNGITRYTAGFFMNFENADAAKREIRAIGYSDAFVVAYKDGKRIPLYEAMAKTEGENMMAAVEKEYIYGDKGEAPKSTVKAAPKPAAPATTKAPAKPSNKTTGANNNGSIIYTASLSNNAGDYYAGYPDAAKATKVEATQGLFFTVQVGVYSRPVPAKSLHYINPLNSELTETKKIRYTSGMYTSLQEAVDKRTEARAIGITDAFVTAYYNGQRISLSEADRLLKEKGNGILIAKGIN